MTPVVAYMFLISKSCIAAYRNGVQQLRQRVKDLE